MACAAGTEGGTFVDNLLVGGAASAAGRGFFRSGLLIGVLGWHAYGYIEAGRSDA